MGDGIWLFVGGSSAIIGLVCFPQGSTYDMSFRKLGRFVGAFVYLSVFIIMWCLVVTGSKSIPVLEKFQSWCIPVPETFQSWCLAVGSKRIQVSEKFKGVVGAIPFVVICSISVVHDKYVTGISDAFTIISYGSFGLMSVSLSKESELGFETAFTEFFLQLFAAQLFKIKWFLLPIALFFCSLIIMLRHYSKGPKVNDAGSKDEGPPDVPPSANAPEIGNGKDVEGQVSRERRDPAPLKPPQNLNTTVEGDIEGQVTIDIEVPGQRQLSTNNEQNIEVESSQAVGEVSEENISDGDDDQIALLTGSSAVGSSYSSKQRQVSSTFGPKRPRPAPRRGEVLRKVVADILKNKEE